jgi:acyl carrier protein
MSAGSSTHDQPLSYDEFVAYVGQELGIDLRGTSAGTVVGVDLEMDSVTMLELIVAIEDIGAELPTDYFLAGRTLGDAYKEYVHAVSAAPPLPPDST